MVNKRSFDLSSSKEPKRIKTFEELEDFEKLSKECLNKTLIKAAKSGDAKTVETLLKLGADVNTQNGEKQTPLHLASARAEHAVAKILLENGANVDTQDWYGQTPLHRALEIEGDLEIVQTLLKIGADVNTQNDKNQTPLHLASNRKNYNMVKLLLENGAYLQSV